MSEHETGNDGRLMALTYGIINKPVNVKQTLAEGRRRQTTILILFPRATACETDSLTKLQQKGIA
jgi:hypothetical protein